MLRPDERTHFLELLRPPPGCHLDRAVGTTFSLDLESALMLPLAFALFDWEQNDGTPIADPLALLEALRRYGDRYSVFCQGGQIRLPAKYTPLVTFLEPCIHEVTPPDDQGVFHPKVWVLRLRDENQGIRYRVLCLSRNLTFDRCWDTVVALDGELTDRTNAIAANHPLAEFVLALPGLARTALPKAEATAIKRIADELRRVRFEWPEGFDEKQCGFWVGGLDGRPFDPFGDRRDKSLIVSPFLSDSVIQSFLDHEGKVHLVSRPESLQEISQKTRTGCASIRVVMPETADEASDDLPLADQREVLEGLHAKIFVIDRGWDASILVGSANATNHARAHNVEFMVELVGKRSQVGVEALLTSVPGEMRFADLLQTYDPDEGQKPDPAIAQIDKLFFAAKRALAQAEPRLVVSAAAQVETFDLALAWRRTIQVPHGVAQMRAWPITLPRDRAQSVRDPVKFSSLSYFGLTPLLAVSVEVTVGERSSECVFVTNAPLEGAPSDRPDRVLRSLINDREKLFRYIEFLLSAEDDAISTSDLRHLLNGTDSIRKGAAKPYLLEALLRALQRDPRQLQRVASLIAALGQPEDNSELLSDEFQRVWRPIWEVARERIP